VTIQDPANNWNKISLAPFARRVTSARQQAAFAALKGQQKGNVEAA
jgi:hypothetical protein